MRHRRLSEALLVIGLFCAAPSVASAATLTLSTSADPTEEVPFQVTATYAADTASPAVLVTVKPGGGAPCASVYKSEAPSSNDVIYAPGLSRQSGQETSTATQASPGTYVLCGYVQDSTGSDAAQIAKQLDVVVRPIRATLAISSATVPAEQSVQLTAQYTAELRRSLFVVIKPSGGRPCEANYPLEEPQSTDVLYDQSVQGSGAYPFSFSAPSDAGSYLVCGFVQESSSDLQPAAVASATLTVSPSPCDIATAQLGVLEQAARTATAKATAALKGKRFAKTQVDRALRSYQGARRRHVSRSALRTLLTRYDARRKSYAQRSNAYDAAAKATSRARSAVVTQQGAVDSAC